MDKNYKPSEKQKNCKYAFPYMGKEMNKNILQKTDAGKKRCRRR